MARRRFEDRADTGQKRFRTFERFEVLDGVVLECVRCMLG